jgi:hypothetical protein
MADFIVSLNEKSLVVFNKLKENTDATNDTAVFLNALSLHATLLNAHQAGWQFQMSKNGETKPFGLFTESNVIPLRYTNRGGLLIKAAPVGILAILD